MKTLLDREDLVFYPPQLGCVLYLPGLPGGGRKIYDRSPYGNQGTIVGATWVRLPSGLWVLDFDGTDDFVSCPHGPEFDFAGKDFTLIAWAKEDDTGANMIMSQTINASNRVWTLYFTATFNFVASIDGTTWGVTMTGGSVSADTWYQFAVTRRGSTFTKLLNGVSVETVIEAGALNTEVSDLKIGRDFDSGGSFMNGKIALPRVLNGVGLSNMEIQNIFNREKHLFGVWSR